MPKLNRIILDVKTPTLEQARAAKQKLALQLADVDGVVGVGITKVNGHYAVKVNLQEPLPNPTPIPSHIEGVPVDVEVVGTIHLRTMS